MLKLISFSFTEMGPFSILLRRMGTTSPALLDSSDSNYTLMYMVTLSLSCFTAWQNMDRMRLSRWAMRLFREQSISKSMNKWNSLCDKSKPQIWS